METLADTVTVEVGIPKEVMARLTARARACGRGVSEYLRGLIEQDLAAGPRRPSPTLDEILAPVHEDFERSGMTEDELYDFLEELREQVWQEKHGAATRRCPATRGPVWSSTA